MKIDFNQPTEEKPHSTGEGIQKIWRFKNGLGASDVQFKVMGRWASYTSDEAEWELAVIKFKGKGFSLTYETKITNDVIGHLKADDVVKLLKRIQKLK